MTACFSAYSFRRSGARPNCSPSLEKQCEPGPFGSKLCRHELPTPALPRRLWKRQTVNADDILAAGISMPTFNHLQEFL